jgi:hypothetical protein
MNVPVERSAALPKGAKNSRQEVKRFIRPVPVRRLRYETMKTTGIP